MHELTIRTVKLTVVLPTDQLTSLTVPDAAPPQELSLRCDGRRFTVKVKAKSLRQAVSLIAEHGPDKVVVLIQGKLGPDNTILDAGLTAQLKIPKAAAA
jgi:hypothetical protein